LFPEEFILRGVGSQLGAGRLLDRAFGDAKFCVRNEDPIGGRQRFDGSGDGGEYNAGSKNEVEAILDEHDGDVSL